MRDGERDICRQRSFAHAGASRQNDQVAFLKPAQHVVEAAKTGRNARQMTFALIGPLGHFDGAGKRLFKRHEPGAMRAFFGNFVERLLGLVDERGGVFVNFGFKRIRDHFLTNRDQFAAHRQIVNRATILARIGNRRRITRQTRQISSAAKRGKPVIMIEIGFQRNGRSEVAIIDEFADRFVNARMDGVKKMPRQHKIRDLFQRIIIDQ